MPDPASSSPGDPTLHRILDSIDDLSAYLYTTAEAAEVLDCTPEWVRVMSDREQFLPWMEPAISHPRLNLYWRHRVHELNQLRREHPYDFKGPWELPRKNRSGG